MRGELEVVYTKKTILSLTKKGVNQFDSLLNIFIYLNPLAKMPQVEDL